MASLGVMVAPPGVEAPAALSEAVRAGGLVGLWWPDHWMGWAPESIWEELGPIAAAWPSPDLYADPFVEMVELGGATGAPILGTAVTDVVRRHPVGLMQSAESVLRALPETELVLGLGVGERESLAPYGLARTPVDKVAEALEVLRAIRTAGRVTHEGRWWRLDRAPAPAPEARERLRVWLGAHGPRMRRLAAEGAEGWIPVGLSPGAIGGLAEEMRRAAEPGWEVAVCVPVALLDADLDEQEVTQSAALRWLSLFWDPAAFRKAGVEHPLGANFDPMRSFVPGHLERDEALGLLEAVPPAVVREVVQCGGRKEIADLLGRYGAAGVDHVVLWEVGHLVAPERRARSIELSCEAWTMTNGRSLG
ncbi:MAG TPA: LLM class flavin-dependent oxidoreductase [Solirubrobacterales bacterium]|nr:LLM class flavin-dependent oxidoreductase [Solirubrobacterales bacterium]